MEESISSLSLALVHLPLSLARNFSLSLGISLFFSSISRVLFLLLARVVLIPLPRTLFFLASVRLLLLLSSFSPLFQSLHIFSRDFSVSAPCHLARNLSSTRTSARKCKTTAAAMLFISMTASSLPGQIRAPA